MRRHVRGMIFVFILFFSVCLRGIQAYADANITEKYERDYLSQIFDSENGLDGTTANCVYPDADGFLWFGSYTGLYRYDGTDFKKYMVEGRSLPVNDLVQDTKGDFWIGTNGDGIYRFDGTDFEEIKLEKEDQGASVINSLYLDEQEVLWVGTKSGVFSIDTKNDCKVKKYEDCANLAVRDIGAISEGSILAVMKTGEVFLIRDDETRQLQLASEGAGVPRCFFAINETEFYIGTSADCLLKLSSRGEVLKTIDGNGLSSFNDIYAIDKESYWVCSDSGIGVLKDDTITKIDSSFQSSVEEGCVDYQGSYWFVSSRQGILHLYQNYFSDMGAYWGIHQTVNAIQPLGNKVYVGCEDGLSCFEGKNKVKDTLTEACEGLRIRQLFLDDQETLWVVSYENGLRLMDAAGTITSINTENSDLGTNKTRCIWKRENGEVFIGTEEGLYLRDSQGKVSKYTDNTVLNETRILDICEGYDGKIYVSTDGYGAYEVTNGVVSDIYTKEKGLMSDVVLKVVPSVNLKGVWIVTGEGLCFVKENGEIQRATGVPVSNSLDLILTEDGNAVVLAGNGFFEIKEEALLQENAQCFYLSKKNGLPIDFTANARNSLQGKVLYMCGTTGAAAICVDSEIAETPVRLYINAVEEDGEDVAIDPKMITISAEAKKVSIDVRVINYIDRNFYASYCLDGVDDDAVFTEDLKAANVSYTNLKGGTYTYTYRIYDENTKGALKTLSLRFHKNYKFIEQLEVRILLTLLGFGAFVLLTIYLVYVRDKNIKKQYYLAYLQKKEQEMTALTHKDLVTGAFNRNRFENEKNKIDMKKLYAMVSVSVDYAEYFKRKYGVFFTDEIYRKGIKIIREHTKEKIEIYRVSENSFYFWFMEPIQLENYIYDLKNAFWEEGTKANLPLSFSIGGIYNNAMGKENIDELIERCDKMRCLDEKHAEARFIEGKVKML